MSIGIYSALETFDVLTGTVMSSNDASRTVETPSGAALGMQAACFAWVWLGQVMFPSIQAPSVTVPFPIGFVPRCMEE